MANCSLTTEYSRKGISCIWLENDDLRVEILSGKGGDITEIRDKQTDVNVLFEAPHEWRSPNDGPIGAPDSEFTFLDSYPGGWQDVLPGAGGPSEGDGSAPLGLHGETPLVPWDTKVIEETPERVTIELSVELTRYPLAIERQCTVEANDPTLYISEEVRNIGEVGVHYSWLQHIALGEPLVSPGARIDAPCERVLVDPGQTGANARLPPGVEFQWPLYDDGDRVIDISEFPPKSDRVHDLVALTDFDTGWYTVTNQELDLGVTVEFPADLYEYLWYWQPFGGFEDAPFYGRNYNIGLEPCTSVPNAGLEAAKKNGTAAFLSPEETQSAEISLTTHSASSRPR